MEGKNYIPDKVLEEANGDPRAAFGIMALSELDATPKKPTRQITTEMDVNEEYAMQSPKDVWTLMDDI